MRNWQGVPDTRRPSPVPGYTAGAAGSLPASAGPYLCPIYRLYPTAMLSGTVKFYDDTKGFGFIIEDDHEEEIFVHHTGLVHEIESGDRVQFNIKAGKQGPNAVDVVRVTQ